MQVILGILFIFLLGSTTAQQFSDYPYDYDIDSFTPECKEALNETLQCSSVLAFIEADNTAPTKNDLTELCTAECHGSLFQIQKNIQNACPVSTNMIEYTGGGISTAQERINSFLDTFTRTCIKDPYCALDPSIALLMLTEMCSATKDFCFEIMRSWPVAENMTSEQNCSDCLLGLVQLSLSSVFTYDDEVALEFSSLTESCEKTGFKPEVPTRIGTNHTRTTTFSATLTQDCVSTHVIEEDDTCNGICQTYNVSTDALTQANGLYAYCHKFPKAGTELCIPEECDIYTVDSKDTCWTIVMKFRGSFSFNQLIAWNPQLNALCTNMPQQRDMQICISPPGRIRWRSSTTGAVTAPPTPLYVNVS